MALSRALGRRAEAAPSGRTRSPLVRNLAYLAGGQVATWTLSAIWTVVVPRTLGPSGMGQLTIAWSAVAIVNVICTFGTDVLITKEVARDRSAAPRLVGAGILLRLLSAPLGWILIVSYIAVTHFGPTQILALVLATFAMQISLLTGVLQSGFQGIERMEYLAYADVFSKTLMTVASIVLVLSGFGVVAILGLSVAIAVVVLFLVLRWSRAHFHVAWRAGWSELFALLKGGFPFWATGLFLTAYIWIDSVMLGAMTNETVVGWYGAPTRLFATLLFIPAVLSTAWFPRLVSAYGEGLDQFRVALARVLGWTVILSLPLAAGLVAVSGPLIAILYGPRFSESALVLAVLGMLLPFTYLNIIASQALAASNRQLRWTAIMAAATVVNPLINLVFIPFFQARWHNGAIGAALSLLATEILMSFAALFTVRGSLGAVKGVRLMKALLAAAFMGTLAWLVAPYGLVAQVAAGGVTFLALALLLRIPTSEEMAYALNFGRRFLGSGPVEEPAA